ncbi:cysteine proteinase 1 [Heterostelium album PN500]|uniref:Cysteine proteinase 1 n=1 Tax=Heterostelium pallidum (strain ATCC 26659 / Pp 5 / PN500) TaxID=670386 RepID=D3B314_HETP5|nr:cysteine proteinase 1 [Heterostelium album PN500]EFA83712.1 cysteine proteinase 1 [Heterostelium album PN500]|eukprot:XP_020435829.1 cysteine proteinase 1 [Heterostelium album PN500]
MRSVIILTVLLLVSMAAAKKLSLEETQFRQFQIKYNKQYTSSEYAERFATFKSNLKVIDEKNRDAASRKSSVRFGVNEFADLSQSEFRATYLNSVQAVRDPNAAVAADLPVEDLPTAFDWRTKGAVTGVKNQGQCGSCWSFSTTGNVEGQWFLAGNTLTGLSEQNLVDCDHECMEYLGDNVCDQGCNGGLQPNAYTYIIKNGGIDTEASYPYQGVDGTCSFKAANIGAKISNWTYVSSNETQMAAYLVANGPLAIAADAVEWQFYLGGVFDVPCGNTLDHGILIVGYSAENTIFHKDKAYWIVKNSWGATWGEQGYIYISRGNGECVSKTTSTPTPKATLSTTPTTTLTSTNTKKGETKSDSEIDIDVIETSEKDSYLTSESPFSIQEKKLLSNCLCPLCLKQVVFISKNKYKPDTVKMAIFCLYMLKKHNYRFDRNEIIEFIKDHWEFFKINRVKYVWYDPRAK